MTFGMHRERVGGVMHTSISTIVQSELTSQQVPKSTSEMLFLWMAKKIGRPILVFAGVRHFYSLPVMQRADHGNRRAICAW